MVPRRSRGGKESEITRVLSRLNKEKRRELLLLMGDPPDIRLVPQSFWDSLEDETRNLLLLILLTIHSTASQRLEGAVGRQLDETDRLQAATSYAEDRASRVGRSFAEHAKERLESAAQKLADGKIENLGERELRKFIGRRSATDVAITETTEANASGEMEAVDQIREGNAPDTLEDGPFDKGPQIIITWITEADSKVCPICIPLHLTPESFWRRFFPEGPTAHPRCRCDLSYQVDGRTVLPSKKIFNTITIQQASDRLAARNHILGTTVGKDRDGKHRYNVTTPTGASVVMTTAEIKRLI